MSLEHNFEFRRAYKDWKVAKQSFEQDQTDTHPERTGGLMNLGINDPDSYQAIIKRRGIVYDAYFGNEEKIKKLILETPGQYGLWGSVHYQDGDDDFFSWFEYNVCLEFGGDRFIANCMVESVTLEQAEDETARVLIAEDLSHRIKLPPGYPMTVRPDIMPLWEKPLLWTPPLGDEPLILTKEQMAIVVNGLVKQA